ncbi:MAG: AAA family ATPase [Lachnospiraceae bacterium]|nr:AAA family ATPase [Lachnospiraceae bacterium]
MDPVRIRYMKEQIAQLPKGNITYKTIRDKKYAYLQWTENGKQKSRRVKDGELQELSEKIKMRKVLEKKLKEAPEAAVMPDIMKEEFFFSEVKYGQELLDFVEPVRAYKKRECFGELCDYVYGNSTDRVFILYGLRRTGKTTLIRQVISEMPEKMLQQTAFVQITPQVDLAKINLDMRQLKKQGYRYLFIDEVTLMDDFIEGAALFSDIFASSGMKVVLSGTDSLGFVFSEDSQLYDRCFMVHTTFVPYREFEKVLGIRGIDEYIRYGSTMSLGGINYNHTGRTFATKESTTEYVDSAIARNIQNSLKNYQEGTHFRHLADLYEANELTSAINRIVEDINHRFTLSVLTKDFKSNDLALSAKNLLRDRNNPNTILQQIDREEVTRQLRGILEIKNQPERTVEISEAHRAVIKEYLDMLDITVDIDTVYLPDWNKKEKRTVITQPGMRYAQAEALIKTLMQDDVFRTFSLAERNAVTARILSDIQGRMMEDIVLLETKMALPTCEVFKLVFARGEFDMVVFDPNAASCSIYEVKHSAEAIDEQYRHLIDEEKCKATEFRFGPIAGKYVIYRGETHDRNGIRYLNVEEYLHGFAK